MFLSKLIKYSRVVVATLLLTACGSSSSTEIDGNATTYIDANSTTSGNTSTEDKITLKIYVAGESIEEFNHMKTLPFNADGTLNGTANSKDEYGWMVPFAQRLQIRDSNLAVQWVGANCWSNQNTYECSDATYTNSTIGHTSALAGSTIESWQIVFGEELANQEHCYDIAFASRGGNDLNIDLSATTYEAQLKELVLDLDQGSNCRTHPIVYVTAHMLDTGSMNSTHSQSDVDGWLERQKAYYVDITKRVVDDLNSDGRNIRFIDMWTPIYEDTKSTAFPTETWWITENGVRKPDLEKIHLDGTQHPARLASIFMGESVADQINISEIKALK
ncbi:hypothetical protein GSY74_10645 [Sulfurovum sp. bin170]|uniref:hypothetical protein n=1 Tax=Sulfurovum sp. bin170 TaxID=2695268 RepID=UPI0013DFDE9B|nr:hypothetical protein [Sulfurovum sp. bin170]NEW61745.1 hypothetical protein [Sulfurovum sp. bin170]